MIRTYNSGDEVEIVELWNQSCPKDPMSLSIFIKRVLVDPNFDPEGLILYEEAGNIVGVLFAVVRKLPLYQVDLEPNNGWITTFFVHPCHRSAGIGKALFAAAEEFFKKRGRTTVFFSSYAPNYFVPGLDSERYPQAKQLLDKVGFDVQYSPVAMDKRLVGFEYPEDVRTLKQNRMNEGFTFEPLTTKYVTEVIRFNEEVFNPDWARAIREAIAHGVGLHHVLIARKDEAVVGFCMYGAYDGVGERFGPFGVHPAMRGTGIGKILLYDCMHRMAAQGLHNAWFLWTGETSPAGYLYLRAGFEVTRRFDVMKKEI